MSEVIQAIFVRETETRQHPKPHTVYRVEVQAAVRTWSVWKRFSEFTTLHNQLESIFPKHPPPLQLPARNIFPPTFSDAAKIEERRQGLEAYLRAILSNKDDCWRQTDVWKEFLAIPTGRSLDPVSMYNLETWLDEYNALSGLAREVRSLVNRRVTHIARNEVSASHNATVQAKKLLVTLSTRLSNLESGLVSLAHGSAEGGAMAEGELRRRQDMLDTLKDEKEALQKLVNSGRQEQELLYGAKQLPSAGLVRSNSATELTSDTSTVSSEKDAYNYGFPTPNPVQRRPATEPRLGKTLNPGRAFGAAALEQQQRLAKETQVTRGLDNEGLLEYQRQVMADQDAQVEQFSALLARQKQIGYAIGEELEAQNQILDELDADVGRTAMKLKFANKKLTTIK